MDDFTRQCAVSEMQLKHVPILDTFTPIAAFNDDLQKALDSAEIKGMNVPKAEGVVWKCVEDPSLSFKILSNEYLLKENTD